MNVYEKIFWRIAQEIEILDSATFRHPEFGTLEPPRDLDVDPERPVLAHLHRLIYLTYYAGDYFAAELFLRGGRRAASLQGHEDYELVSRIQAADAGRGQVQDGWVVRSRRGRDYLVTKDALTLRAAPEELIAEGPLTEGAEVALRLPSGRPYLLLGWYTIFGDHGGLDGRADGLVRLYLTLADADAAPELVHAITRALNDLHVPFQLKLVNNQEAFERRDAFVVYIGAGAWERHRTVIEEIHRSRENRFRDDHPCFALRLARGFSFAQEPEIEGQRTSFGLHRCQLVAEGLVRAYEEGRHSPRERFLSIKERYVEEGLDIRRPYLNAPGSRKTSSLVGA
ncbi:T3SS effector HopA1 family protein [Microbispora sp. NPDC049633]|uniref:T3SS effector HopA1 family protein n=1 Tax=Microbispora sp. NPDC049633 TaxID=3154355 RepID=UPI00343A3963